MAANVSVIGRTARVRGRVSGEADLEVHGFVEGDIAVSGDVTVDAHGMVGAGVRGRRLVVRGAVKGDLVGLEAIVLEDGARVVGDVRAPRVAIAAGALVRGFVETGEHDGASARASRPQAAARATPAAARAPAPVVARAPAAPATAAAAPGATSANATTNKHAASANHASGNSTTAAAGAARRPPPPV